MAERRRILFVFRDLGRIRYFEAALEELASQSHDLHLVIERYAERIPGQLKFVEGLASRHPNVSYGRAPKRKADRWRALSRAIRLGLDCAHYLDPRFDTAPELRERAARDAPGLVMRVATSRVGRTRAGARLLRRALARAERAIPAPDSIVDHLKRVNPDVLLVTPLVWFGAPQADWIRAARRLGIRSVGCLFSWDNLTSKGSMPEIPDVLTVWNSVQVKEANALHGVPLERIMQTGAHNWDHWFGWSPSRSRESFCREVGLDPAEPYVLYLESSGFVGGEGPFVAEWVRRLRASEHEAVREAGVLVRPHPQAITDEWTEVVKQAAVRPIAVWPREGRVPLDEATRRDFYDSLWHAAAVFGINTSSFIEAAILDRPCLTILDERFRRGQTGTVHFHHLMEENGGPVRSARSLDEHHEQLAIAISSPASASHRNRNFVRTFVRPFGEEVSAGRLFADTIESLSRRPPRAAEAPTRGDLRLGRGLTRLQERLAR